MTGHGGTGEKTPAVTAVISTHNRRGEVAVTLRALENCRYPGLEVIVVDNASSDGTERMVREKFPAVRLITQAKNDPLAGYNLAFRVAAPYLLVLDDDSAPRSGVLERMVAAMEEHPQVGLAAANVVSTAGVSEWGPAVEPQLTMEWYNVIGCGFLARREVLEEAGGYNEKFGLYYNDLDLALRVLALGHRVAFCADWMVEHRKAPSNRAAGLKAKMMLRNFPLAVRSHFSGLEAADLILGHTLMMVPPARRGRCLLAGLRGWASTLSGPTGRTRLGLPETPARREFVKTYALTARRFSRQERRFA